MEDTLEKAGGEETMSDKLKVNMKNWKYSVQAWEKKKKCGMLSSVRL